jgi:hypothetical protein
MERSGIAIWWSALLFELLHSLLDLLFQFLHISLALGCRKYFDTWIHDNLPLYGLIFRSLLWPTPNHARKETAWRFESPEYWHRFQELILPYQSRSGKDTTVSAVTGNGGSIDQEKCQ